ncbi:hypothetical protein [Psychroserpens sp.]|uniref:hypothetical protein n=1 Tax=Psychroserpens sp. TaxID=2020870 RepID=UPI002B2776B6|nr:hypothetical protein [Psychroserpens sp.]
MNNRGRIQAQDDNLEESESWATNDEITKQEGLNKSNDLKEKLSNQELAERINAFNKLERVIQQAPSQGYYAQLIKSFHHNPQNRRIRVDLEIRAGIAFIDQNTN